jgi:hypothetical protein
VWILNFVRKKSFTILDPCILNVNSTMFHRLVVLALLGVAAAASDETCRTSCFDASDACETDCLALDASVSYKCLEDCEPALESCMLLCPSLPHRGDALQDEGLMEMDRELQQRTKVVYTDFGNFTINVKHDDYPGDTAFQLTRIRPSSRLVASQVTGFVTVPQQLVTVSFVITNTSRYRFKIFDDYGDGLLAPGFWEARLNGVRIYKAPPFRFSQTVIFDFSP